MLRSMTARPPLSATLHSIAPSARTALRRHADRGSYDAELIHSVLDEALVCHVGVVVDGSPRVMPTMHVRVGEHLYLHGARANRFLGEVARGAPVCITVTLLDGLVFGRSWFHHSMNYRSVVVYGAGEEVTEPAQKLSALAALIERAAPGRSSEARAPTDAELRGTLVVRVPIAEASAKVRTGRPLDGPELLDEPAWAGVLPLSLIAGAPIADPELRAGTPVSRAVELAYGVSRERMAATNATRSPR